MRYVALKLLRRFGFDVQRYGPHRDPVRRFQHALARHDVQTVLDIGANVGQFGQRLRINGYSGTIISVEPLSEAHAKLMTLAKNDHRWLVTPRCAVGATCEMMEINIAANSQSSSMLNMLDRHVAGDPKSGYVGKETVRVLTLDAFLDIYMAQTEAVPSPRSWYHRGSETAPLGMKVDTQGFELQVLAGLNKWSGLVKVVQIEMSLAPLYEGSASFIDLYGVMQDRGYRCISIEPNFIDPKTYEVLQADAIFEQVG